VAAAVIISRAFEPPDLVIATLAGVVTSGDQASVIEWIRNWVRDAGTVRVLVVLELFGGWHPPDSLDDPRMWLRDDEGVSKMAFVGALTWKRSVLTFLAQPVRRLPIEYFDSESAARRWLHEEAGQRTSIIST
jgi:SpoIIAA-like